MVNQSSFQMNPLVELSSDAVNTSKDLHSSCGCCSDRVDDAPANELNVNEPSNAHDGYFPEVWQSEIKNKVNMNDQLCYIY